MDRLFLLNSLRIFLISGKYFLYELHGLKNHPALRAPLQRKGTKKPVTIDRLFLCISKKFIFPF